MLAEIRKISDDSRTVEMSFSSEAPVDSYWGPEILNHDAESVDLKRLKDVGTVLFSHGRDSNYGRMPIASIDDVWLDSNDRKLRAKITFDDDTESEKVFQKVNKGLIKGVSFGYRVSSWEEVSPGKPSANGRFMGPCSVGLRWEPFEISIEPTPADPSVGVGRSLDSAMEAKKPDLSEQRKYMRELRKKINT